MPPDADSDNSDDASAGAGRLHVVATPLGNLEDITYRALRILREVDLIAAEDTRVTRKLLAHFAIHTPLTAYHAHSGDRQKESLLGRLRQGENIALVSDAGTPGISDPGAELIADAIAQQIRVEPIPGACAAITALVGAGLDTARFVFEGFLPRAGRERRERLEISAREPRTVIVYESPQRLVSTLTDLAHVTSEMRRVTVARELTKKFEEFQRGTLRSVRAFYQENPPRGECVIVLSGAETDAAPASSSPAGQDPERLLQAALDNGLSPRDAARTVAAATGLARNRLYPRAVALHQNPPTESPRSARE